MTDDDDIPVLKDAVARRSPRLTAKQLDEICASVSEATAHLVNSLLAEAMQTVATSIREEISEQLDDELPELIEKTIHKQLGNAPENN